MATLERAIKEGKLVKFQATLNLGRKVDLYVGQLAQRVIYMTPEARDWCYCTRELGYQAPNPKAYDIVRATLADFVYGQKFRLGDDIRRLDPNKDDIWEIKTKPPDAVRVFGWFYRENVFIVSHCAYKVNLPKYKDYKPEIQKVKDLAEELSFFRSETGKWNKDEKGYFLL
jgi:hypothetical protein